MIVDSHAHLDSDAFDSDRDEIVSRALEAGVERIITIGCDLESSHDAIELAEKYPSVYAAVGIHPTYAHTIEDPNWLEVLRKLAGHPKVVAIGEIGLDYYHPPGGGMSEADYKAQQSEFFIRQLELTAELNMNAVIHQRNSSEDTASHVVPFDDRLQAVFHCFSGSPAEAAALIERGHLVSFTGIASFKNAKDVHETVKCVPADKFMVETDAPYLSPVPYRGKRCEPAYTRNTAEAIAAHRGVTLQEIEQATTQTAFEFFKGLE